MQGQYLQQLQRRLPAVYKVSCLRLPLFDVESRSRVQQTAMQMFDMAAAFARQQQDQGFGQRLLLGLARNLISSTRFLLDGPHAQDLFEQGVLLLEALAATGAEAAGKALEPLLQQWLLGWSRQPPRSASVLQRDGLALRQGQ